MIEAALAMLIAPVHVQVDPTAPDLSAFPAFAEVAALEAALGPGDVIFFPVGQSLDESFTEPT